MSGVDNAVPVTAEDARRLEAAMRRAIDGVEPQLRGLRRRLVGDYATLPAWWVFAKAQAPQLLALAGGGCFLVAVWPQPLLCVGCVLLIAGTALGLWRAVR